MCRYEEAMQAAEGKEYELRTHNMLSIRQKYLADLVEGGDFPKAAQNCPAILGTDVERVILAHLFRFTLPICFVGF
jgi:hypothetical protein